MDGETDPNQIAVIQNRLVEWSWLLPDTFTPGLLDEATINAVAGFQGYCVENLATELTPIDAELPVIDAPTLGVLMNALDEIYINPNAM